MHAIDTSIAIAAGPMAVWEVLVDFPAYAEWNPFIIEAHGEPAAGASLTVRIQPPGNDAMTHHPVVITADPGRCLRWLGKLAIPGLFSARHEFLLEPAGDGTLLRHREEFRGLLVPFLGRTLRRTEEGFHVMNHALSDRVRHRAG